MNKKLQLQQNNMLQRTEEMVNRASVAANALVPQADGTLSFYGYHLTRVGIQSLDGVKPAQWQELGEILASLQSGIQWLVGDWAAYGENVAYGDMAKIAQVVGLAEQTVYDYAYVARKVEFSIRIETLSFGHHQVVASLAPEQQAYWLQIAQAENLSVAKLRKAIQDANQPPVLLASGDEFSLVTATTIKRLERELKLQSDARQRQVWLDVLQEWINQHRQTLE